MTMKLSGKVAAFGVAFLGIIWIGIIIGSGLGWNPFAARWDFSNTGAFGDSFGPLSAAMAAIAAVPPYLRGAAKLPRQTVQRQMRRFRDKKLLPRETKLRFSK